MTRLLMSGVAVAALLAFGSMANAQSEQPSTQTMPNQGGGSGPDTGAGGAAGTDVQGQGGADVQTQGGAGAQTQTPQDTQSGQSQQKSSDSMEKSSDTKKKSSDMQKQTDESGGADKTKKQSQSSESSGATGATGKAGKIDVPQGKRSQVAKSFSSHKVKHVDIDVDVSVGVAVPRTVVLHAVPADIVEIVPGFRGYRYFVLASGEIVIVDPATFVVVYVLPV